jgi:heat-inducible transcriptional repressor
VAKRYGLGVSPATVRNAMSDLEEKGYLYHPHTSAGRIPTDQAYRYYVDTLMQPVRLSVAEQRRVRRELREADGDSGALAQLVRHAAQVLGLLTGDLGIGVAPKLELAVLEKIETAMVSSEKVLLVLTLRGGLVRTVYVDLPVSVPAETLAAVTVVLNERMAGQTLSELRATLPERLRDASGEGEGSRELLNIVLQSADELLEPAAPEQVVLGHASVLATQPEFAESERLRGLLELTEQRQLLHRVLASREHEMAPFITIGSEHGDPRLSSFTLVTSRYRMGNLTGVVGVLGPTRMPYEKVAAIVEYTSRLMGELTT